MEYPIQVLRSQLHKDELSLRVAEREHEIAPNTVNRNILLNNRKRVSDLRHAMHILSEYYYGSNGRTYIVVFN